MGRATLQLRHPSWAHGVTASVNGRPWEVPGVPGSFIPVTREWRSGDEIEVRFSMRLNTEALAGAPNHVAFLYGPVVLAGRMGRPGFYPGCDILRAVEISGTLLVEPVEVPVLVGPPACVVEGVRPVPGGKPLTFETVGIGRPRDVRLVPYYRLHHERYNLYWEVV